MSNMSVFREQGWIATLLQKKCSRAICSPSSVTSIPTFPSLITDSRPVSLTPLRETHVADFPKIAVREFLLNAILHRSYEAPQPVRFYHFSDRMEIQNPGPLYGLARRDNFPDQTSYRNPVLAEALKTLGFVNRFGRGVRRAHTRSMPTAARPPSSSSANSTLVLRFESVHENHRIL